MKTIVISAIILILSISFFFGIFAFAEWNVNPDYWNGGTRSFCSMIFGFSFVAWLGFVIAFMATNNERW